MAAVLGGIALASNIVELTNKGFALAKELHDKIKIYKNAPREVRRVAHEVTMWSEMMSLLGERLAARATVCGFSEEFEVSVRGLAEHVSG